MIWGETPCGCNSSTVDAMDLETPPTHRQLHSTFSLLSCRHQQHWCCVYKHYIIIYISKTHVWIKTCALSHSDWEDQWCERCCTKHFKWCWILGNRPSINDISVGKTSTTTVVRAWNLGISPEDGGDPGSGSLSARLWQDYLILGGSSQDL